MHIARQITLTLAALTLAASGAQATGEQGSLEGYLGKNNQEVSETLKKQGYDVRKVDSEDGYLEAYALRDGKRYEICVYPKSGMLVKMKQD